jgi:hypothetical protein
MRRSCTAALLLAVVMSLASAGSAGARVTSGFTQTPISPVVNQVVTFTSTSTAPGNNNRLIAQQWDLDNDGAFDDASGATAARAFAPAGTYIVRLRAVDRSSNEAVTAQAIIVRDPPPTPLLSPFPVVQMAGRVTRRGTRIRLSVIAPDGATISIRCRGRGCPLRRQTRIARSDPVASADGTRFIRLRRLERRRLRPGAVVKIFVTKPGMIGKYARFKMRRGKPPRRSDSCVAPGATAPIACPAS